MRDKSVTLICGVCGKDFHPWHSRQTTSRFCSRQCTGEAWSREKATPSAQFFDERYSVNQESGCWEWTGGKLITGYGVMPFDGKRVTSHRYSYERFVGRIPDGHVICHRCDNPSCVNPDHLFAGSQGDNVRDMRQKGRARDNPSLGEAHGCAKLTEEKVKAIRADPRKNSAVARDYGVAPCTVSAIRTRRLWKHVA